MRLTITMSMIGTNIELHNNGLLSKGIIDSFCLDVGRIICNFYFSIVPVCVWGLISTVREGANFFFFSWEGDRPVTAV